MENVTDSAHSKPVPLDCALGLEGLKVYPTRFEAYEAGDAVFQVEAFDESAATVKIDTVLNVEKWDEIAPLIRQCLVDMELT